MSKYPIDLSRLDLKQRDLTPEERAIWEGDPAVEVLALGAEKYLDYVYSELALREREYWRSLFDFAVVNPMRGTTEGDYIIPQLLTWASAGDAFLCAALRWVWALGYSKALADVAREQVII